MLTLIRGLNHRPGQHCASTALSDLSFFYGLNFSEPFCLGLGAGLGFFYLEGDFLSPTRTIMTRAMNLEGNFFQSLGLDFEWLKEPEPAQGWEKVKNLIDQEIPVLLHADIFYLDHYQSQTHFPLHVILLCGYDLEKQSAYIIDTGWEGFIEIPMASLSRARYSKDSFFQLTGDYFPGKLPNQIDRLGQRVKQAILRQAEQLSDSALRGVGWSGYEGMRKAGEKIEQWTSAKDASWCFRWAYQVIERRGTGGGAFRKLYAQFLKEANQRWEELRTAAPFEKMERISNKWTELAMLFKELSEKKRVPESDLKRASKMLLELAEVEQDFFEGAKEKIKKTME